MPEEFATLEVAARAVLVACQGADGWDAAVRRRLLAMLDTASNAITVARARVVTAERDAGTWALQGDRSLAGFVGRVSRQGRGAGMAAVAQAATLDAMPQVAEAMVNGPVTPKHVAEITKAVEASPLLAVRLATDEGQARTVELARKFDGSVFGTKLRELSAGLDPAARQREHDAQRLRRYLTLTHRPDGTEIRGFTDTVSGYRLQKMLDAHNPRPAKDDTRPRDVRQVDALDAIANRVLADTRTTPGATAPVQALVTFREETWAALRAVRGDARVDLTGGGTRAGRSGDRVGAGGDRFVDVARAGGVDEGLRDGGVVGSVGTSSGVMWEPPAVWESPAGSVADVVARLRGVPAVVDETGRAWPVSEVARALCDCVLTRAVVDAPNEDLMLGRGERLFTRAHWLALLAAGVTTCAVDGCQMPLAYTELHHITWWRDGGETTLANLAPECSYHHHETHRLGLTVTRRPDGSYEHRHPDGRPYGGMPRDDPDDGPPPVLSLYDTA